MEIARRAEERREGPIAQKVRTASGNAENIDVKAADLPLTDLRQISLD